MDRPIPLPALRPGIQVRCYLWVPPRSPWCLVGFQWFRNRSRWSRGTLPRGDKDCARDRGALPTDVGVLEGASGFPSRCTSAVLRSPPRVEWYPEEGFPTPVTHRQTLSFAKRRVCRTHFIAENRSGTGTNNQLERAIAWSAPIALLGTGEAGDAPEGSPHYGGVVQPLP